jgi:hypothetical protein
VTKRLVPRTNKQIAKCHAKGHICAEITKWHGAKGNSPPTINPVDVGKPGWDRPGNLKRKGDSVFFTPQQPAATRVVSAKAGKTLHFICAIHPEMHGTIHVK